MALARLPIFPLPDVVLFPHAVLPLHVFEPRYRAMTRDVLAGDRLLSVVRLRPGYEREYEGRPPVYQVAGLGEVIESEALDDGRYNMLLRGIGRIRIEREHPTELPYRVVAARRLHDEYRGADLEVSTSAVHALTERLASALPEGGDTLRQVVRGIDDAGALADVLAACVVVDPDNRQKLLETLDVESRLQKVSDAIVGLLGQLPEPSPSAAN